MLCKLALRNVRRSVRDYTLYFLTLFFGVCVFYVFNSLENQWVMRALMENSRNVDYAGAIVRLIDLVSVFVTAVLAFLILYANHFLLRRRKRELVVLFDILALLQAAVHQKAAAVHLQAVAAAGDFLVGSVKGQFHGGFSFPIVRVLIQNGLAPASPGGMR